MAIRLSGMMSGLDTDAIVQALMTAQKTKKTKIESKKQKLEWKKELWGDMNTKIYNFYKGSLSKIKMQTSFKTKSAVSSDPSKVTATTTANASEGTYKIKVNSTASAQYVTSGKLAGAKDENGNVVKVSSSTKLTDLLDASGNNSFTEGTQINIKSENGTKAASVFIDSETTVADFVTACKSAGLNASFDAGQQRFFIGSGSSGEEQKFTITSSALSNAQQDAVSAWKSGIGYEYLSSGDKAAVSAIFDGLQAGTVTYDDKVESSLKSYLSKAQEAGVTAYYKKQKTDSLNAQYFSDATQETVSAAGKQAYIDDAIASGKTQAEAESTYNTYTAEEQAKAVASIVSKKVSTYMAADTTKADIAAGVTAGVAGAGAFLSASASDRESNILAAAQNYQSIMGSATDNSNQLKGLGLSAVDGTAVAEGTDVAGTGMVVVGAKDSSITLNGATLTSSGSTLTVNGLTLNILADTEGEEISITVSKDTSAVYDTIKDFIGEYNSILKAMNTSYNAASAKDYDVLTDEQKEEMTDDEIEKWEDKIKSSLLRRDDTLYSLISSFRNNMMGSYTASNGKTYSLSSLGISTSTDYKEGGLLHIKGDEDDDVYADETNTLKQLLDEDPDVVMEVLTGLTANLYSDLNKKMASTTMSSALTFYNDKEMNSQLSSYKKEIAKWETKLADMEDRYYSQFTAMEKALANMQSQQSSLSGFFG